MALQIFFLHILSTAYRYNKRDCGVVVDRRFQGWLVIKNLFIFQITIIIPLIIVFIIISSKLNFFINIFPKYLQRQVSKTKKYSIFMDLCCGILTIIPLPSFRQRDCFTRQNGAFSTTPKNRILFCFRNRLL